MDMLTNHPTDSHAYAIVTRCVIIILISKIFFQVLNQYINAMTVLARV